MPAHGASAPEYLGATLENYLNDHVATWNVKSGKFETLVDVELNFVNNDLSLFPFFTKTLFRPDTFLPGQFSF